MESRPDVFTEVSDFFFLFLFIEIDGSCISLSQYFSWLPVGLVF